MQAQHITNTHLAHQCARCTKSYRVMYRQDDGLVYCSENGTCQEKVAPELLAAKHVLVKPTPRTAPKRRGAKKSTAKKAAAPKRGRVRA